MISTSFLNNNRYLKILDLTSKSNFFAFTFSRHTPWPIEYIPPSIPPDTTSPSELFAYLKTSSITPVLVVNQGSSYDFSFNGVFYKKIPVPTFPEISSNQCSLACFEATLVHNDLPQSSWRSLGLAISLTQITSTSLIPSNSPSLPTFYHLYLQHSGPKTKETNVTEIVRLVIPISTLL